MLNPNDLFTQIGFVIDQSNKTSPTKSQNKYQSGSKLFSNLNYSINSRIEQDFKQPQYVTSLEIQLSQNDNHLLEIKSFDNPLELAVRFCTKNNLNQLAIQIVENKIIQAMKNQQFKLKNNIQNKSLKNSKKVSPVKAQSSNQFVQRTYNVNESFLKNTAYRRKSPLPKIAQKSLTSLKTQKSSGVLKTQKSSGVIKRQKSSKKAISKQKIQKNPGSTQSTFNTLYFRGLLQQKHKQQARQKYLQQKLKQQSTQLTFKPQINHVSDKIIEFRRETKTVMPKSHNQNKQLKDKYYEEMKQCTFMPHINQVSKIIVHNRQAYRTQNQHFQNVFNNGDNQKVQESCSSTLSLTNQSSIHNKKSREYLQMQKQQEQKKMFKPQLNSKSIQTIKQSFFCRLQKAVSSKQKIRDGQYICDQYSFQPKVGRSPYFQRSLGTSKSNKQNIPIWDQLYQQSKQRVKKIKLEQEKKSKLQASKFVNTTDDSVEHTHEGNSVFASRISNNLYYQNLITKRTNQLFEMLDSDNDGMISPNTIAIENLTKNVLIFLRPIFQEMDELNVELSYNQFSKAVINLLNDSDTHKKGLFLSEKFKQKQPSNEFKPKINPKSRELAQCRSSQSIHLDLYSQGIKNLQKKQFLLQKQRLKKQQQQLAECSFKPCLHMGSKLYEPFDKKLSDIQFSIDNKTNSYDFFNSISQFGGNQNQFHYQQD